MKMNVHAVYLLYYKNVVKVRNHSVNTLQSIGRAHKDLHNGETEVTAF